MEKNDPSSRRLLELVRERVRLSGRSHRDLERELDLGHGTLGNIFRGRTELRLHHVVMLGRVLQFEPLDLFTAAYRPLTPPVRTLPIDLEELHQLIRDALKEELDRRDRGAPLEGEEEQDEPEEPEREEAH